MPTTRRHALLTLPLLLALLLGGPRVRPAAAEAEEPPQAATMAEAANAFARDLYGRVARGDGNLFLSPWSVHACMLLAREGARGETAKQMDAVLRLQDLEAGAGYRALVEALAPPTVTEGWGRDRKEVPAYEFEVANRLFGQQGYAFEAPFVKRLADVYGAPLARLDFGDPAGAREAINHWVEQATRERIQDIVPEGMPPPMTRLVLANAIYMKAAWAEPFSERATEEGDFTGPDGSTSKAKLMRRKGHYAYTERDGVQVLELPYRGGHLSMVVYLPKSHDGLADAETRLREGHLDGKRTRRLVDVTLPRWKVTSALDLTDVLPAMGMPLAFEARKADFSGMTRTERLFVGAVLHKAFVAVDEAGTEAAAVTVAMMKGTAMPPPEETVVFRADRPFAYEIRHRATGAVLFAGRVTRP